MIHTTRTDDSVDVHVDSYFDILDKQVPAINQDQFERSVTDRDSGSDWWGDENGFEGVQKLMQTGWPSGWSRTQQELATNNIPVEVNGINRRRVRRAMGDELDIHRVLAGDLERAWSTTERAQTSAVGKSPITIIVDTTLVHYERIETTFWRGASAILAADAIARSGRPVQILAILATSSLSDEIDRFDASIVAKRFDEPLDPERILLTIGHTGFYRFVMFKLMNLQDGKTNGSYGRCRNARPSILSKTGGHGLLFSGAIKSRESAQEFLDNIEENLLPIEEIVSNIDTNRFDASGR